jgi:hypothetical protein
MNTVVKRSLALATALAVAGGAGFGGWKLYQNRSGSVVKVYDSNELISSYWEENTTTDGVVSTEQFQAEYLSDTQSVKDVQVKEGQKVKKGDVLFTYDSTLTEIDLQRKQIEFQQKELEMQDAQKELSKIRSYRPGKPIPGSSHSYTVPGSDVVPIEHPVYEGLELVSGDGTREMPYSYLWKDTFLLEDTLVGAPMQDKVDCYVRFYLGGKDVEFPEPAPLPEPDPDPKPDDGDGGETGKDEPENPASDDDGKEDKPSGDKSEENEEEEKPSGSEEPSGNTDQDEKNEEDEDPQPEGSVSDTALLSTKEQMPALRDLFLLSSPEEDPVPGFDDPNGESSQGDESSQEEPDPYSVAWVYHCQHTVTGYRYIPVSISVGGVERTVMEPLPPMTDQENPEKQKKAKPKKVKDPGIRYTSAQLAEMRQEQEVVVRDCKLELQQLEVELKKLDRELNNSAVYSALDGVVLELNNPKDLEDNQPVLKVSGGGGYLIRGSVSELALDSVQPGKTVSINDWSTGENYQGTVKAVSEYPSERGGWSEGNNNVSYYSFSVSVDPSANLEENNYVEMSYAQGEEEGGNSVYLLNSFIRSEGAKSYILYEQDGKLVKQYVRTGKNMWGMYTEIIGGLEHTTPVHATVIRLF